MDSRTIRRFACYSWHEWAGLTVFALTALRLMWRLTHRPPPIDLPAWEKVTADVVYVAMYLLLVAQPIVGWLLSAAFGFRVVYLGLLPLPVPVSEDRALAEQLQEVHETLAIGLALLIVMHVAGVLYHHLVRRDAVLSRMLPSVAPRSGGSA